MTTITPPGGYGAPVRPDAPPLTPGLSPVTTGARIGARLLDIALGLPAAAGLLWAVWELRNGVFSILALVGLGAFVLYVAVWLWAVLGRGARLVGLLLGQRWIKADGRRAGWALVGKFLLQEMIGGLTLGIGEPIISLVSLHAPLNRNWFDRITGLTLVRGKALSPLPAPVAAPAQHINVHHVGLPEHRVEQRGSHPSEVSVPSGPLTAPADPALPPAGPALPPAGPALPPAGPGLPPAGPDRRITAVGVREVNAAFIESTPWSGEQVARPSTPPTPPLRPAVVRPRTTNVSAIRPKPVGGGVAGTAGAPAEGQQPGPAQGRAVGGPTRDQGSADHTVFAPHAGSPDGASPGTGQPWLRLDDGSRIDLGTAVVLGREPVAPPDVPTATPHAVVDPTMRLSKTHVAMGRNPDGVWVLDLYSTNGVRVAHPGADVTAVTPGQSTPVPVGSRIEFGGRSLEVCDG